MGRIDFDLQQYDGEFKKAGMDRLEKAAGVIRDKARDLVVTGKVTRVPGRSRMIDSTGHFIPSDNPPIWMERVPGGMKKTIRVVRKAGFKDITAMDAGSGTIWTNDNDVRVYAGNYKTWYATQMEFGRGRWRGGPRSFMRKALIAAEAKIRSIIEG